MTQDEQICSLALTRIPGLGLTGALKLVSNLGSAPVFSNTAKSCHNWSPE